MASSSPTPGKLAELPAIGKADRRNLLGPVLRDVSRAFYLTLRVLPSDMREPVGLAYLLARAADTLVDTPMVPPERRLAALLDFRKLVQGPATTHGVEALLQESIPVAGPSDDISAERVLLASMPRAFAMLEALDAHDRRMVRSVVVALTKGMEMDLTDLAPKMPNEIEAVRDEAHLDAYVYAVAGCVGEFWTAIGMSHQSALKGWDAGRMSRLGVRFGKALQMTNVLRDIPRDLRNGRCYLPHNRLAEAGLTPSALLDPATANDARPVLAQNLRLALDHYRGAEEYLMALPRRCFRLRLAVSWPLLMGLATLARLARNPNWLSPNRPSRVSRQWVYRTMALSALCVWSNLAMRQWIRRLRSQLEKSLLDQNSED